MAILYLDYEGGNDANDGSSFALRVKTMTLGATAARIAPGDTIRVMGSPAATSLGINGTWTDGPLPATKNIVSSTNASPIAVTVTGHGYATGDTVIINAHTTNTFANGTHEITVTGVDTFTLDGSTGNGVGGATGTVRNVNNCRVLLASAVTKNIVKCDVQTGAWTASVNVTSTNNTTDYKDGYGSVQIDIAAGFATGLAAYKAFAAGVTDFSAYKQITFWIKQTAGTLGAAGACTISLCTDALGVVPAQTINIPAITALNQWLPVTVDTGAALSAAAQSLAFNVVTDNGAQTFLIESFTACKDSTSADAISLQSLIGKNTGNETWCAIMAIQGTRVMLDQGNNCLPTSITYRGYAGTTETVTAYKRETIKTALASASLTVIQQNMDAGTAAGGYIYYEGGWDRTAMTTQNLETWFDGGNGLGQALSSSATHAFVSFNKLNFVRYNRALSINGQNNILIDNISVNNCTVSGGIAGLHVANSYAITIGTINSCSYNTGVAGNYGVLFQGNIAASTHTVANMYHCDGNGLIGLSVGLGGAMITKSIFSNLTANNNSSGIALNGAADCVFKTVTSKNNGAYGVTITSSAGNILYNLTTTGNLTGGLTPSGNNYLVDASIAESTEVTSQTGQGGYIFSQGHDATLNNTQIFTDGGRISSTTAVRHTASGYAWQLAPTVTTRTTLYPLVLSLATIMCNASALVTVKAWMRRDNTGITQRLVCKGGQISGVAADVIDTMTAAADTWEQRTITFTPTVQGAVEITTEVFGGATFNAFVDDLTISQA